MTKLIIAAFVVAVGAFAWFSLPAPPKPGQASDEHASHAGDPATLADGVVLSLERTAANITIRHGPIPNLGMPGMTMEFRAGDPALLERIKPGDNVKFHADVVGGALTVMGIEAVN